MYYSQKKYTVEKYSFAMVLETGIIGDIIRTRRIP